MHVRLDRLRITRNLKPERATQLARTLVAVFGGAGLIPLEIVLPPIIAVFDHQSLSFTLLTLYFLVYAFGLTLSLRSYWHRDRKFFYHNKWGKKFNLVLRWARKNSYRERWPFVAKAGYYLVIMMLAALPFLIKFSIGMCVFRMDYKSVIAITIGVAIRAYLIVYLGTDVFNVLFT